MGSAFFDFAEMEASQRYKLLASSVVPRPIAWITTLDEAGTVNAAPFSFFNVFGSDPAIVAIGVGNRPAGSPGASDGGPKDTAHLIRERGEFVVNLVPYELVQAMNITATDFPPGWSEIEAAGLQLAPSRKIAVPRLADSPVNLECREHITLNIGRNRTIIAEVLAMHLREDVVDMAKLHVDTVALGLVGRMGGAGGYARAQDAFHISRLSFAQWQADEGHAGADMAERASAIHAQE